MQGANAWLTACRKKGFGLYWIDHFFPQFLSSEFVGVQFPVY